MLGSAFAQQQSWGETGALVATRSPGAVPDLVRWIRLPSRDCWGQDPAPLGSSCFQRVKFISRTQMSSVLIAHQNKMFSADCLADAGY